MRYAAELKVIADLDEEYYLTPSPNAVERADYYRRQEGLEQIRSRLYAELSAARRSVPQPSAIRVGHNSPREPGR